MSGRRVLTAIAVLGVLSPAALADLSHRYNFKIAPQALSSALIQFSEQADVQVVGRADSYANLKTEGVSGELTAREALRNLIGHNPLLVEEVTDRSVRIVAAPGHGSTEPERSTSASTPPPAPPATAESMTGDPPVLQLEEVVVTAQKRAERLIDTPQSVTVLSSDDITRLGAVQLRDFATTVPGLTLSTAGAGFNQVTLRGVTTGINLSSTVGIYVDDVAFGSSTAFAHGSMLGLDVGLFDIDRIEVLRGPQGTLYGASTIGGLIKYVTRLPDTHNFVGEARTGVSATQHGGINYDVSGAVNLPLASDRAALRISAYESHDGGFMDNAANGRSDVNRSNIYGGRVDFLWTPTEALSIRLVGFLQDINRDGQATADYALTGATDFGALDQHRGFAEPFDQHFRLVSGTVNYDLGAARLTSISSYQSTKTRNFYDLSAAYVPVLNSLPLFGGPYSAVGDPALDVTDKFIQEVRLESAKGAPLDWLIGGFYTHEASNDQQSFALADLAGLPRPNNLFATDSPSSFKEYAAFGDLTYHLARRLDLSGGLRYAHNQQVYTQNGSGLFSGSLPSRESSDGVLTYLANVRYRFTDDATGYLRYATGYRPGGPNAVANDPVTGQPSAPPDFRADRLRSYEAGFKSQFGDRRYALDVDAYYIDWSDIQIFTNYHGFSFNGNAGKASIRGSELTLTALPARGLRLTGAFAYQNARLDQAAPDLGGADGERLPYVPGFTGALTSDYEILSRGTRPTVGATLRYVTRRMASFNQSVADPQYALPAYALLDLRAGVTVHSINAQLYIHNVLDRLGQLSANTGYGPYAQVAIVQPRTVGITLSMSY